MNLEWYRPARVWAGPFRPPPARSRLAASLTPAAIPPDRWGLYQAPSGYSVRLVDAVAAAVAEYEEFTPFRREPD